MDEMNSELMNNDIHGNDKTEQQLELRTFKL